MGTSEANGGPNTMRLPALLPTLAVLLTLTGSLLASPALAAKDDPRPGYGVVESVTPLRQPESASAGASAPGQSKRSAVYLVRVRMNDGGVQIRQVKKTRFSVGDKVLLTNAGDVVPD